MSTDAPALELDAQPAGRNGTVTLTARLGAETVTDKLDVLKAASRDRFAKRVAERWPAVEAAEVGAELERIAGEHTTKEAPPSQPDPAHELDLSDVARPELFITRDVMGMAVPVLGEAGGKVCGRWMIFLQWADGRRERCELGPSMTLPDGRRLWLHPEPAEPGAHDAKRLGGWSAEARRAWLDGHAPDAGDVFKRSCERIAYYIDLPPEHAPGTTATLALWSMLTYIYPAFDAVPYLLITGALGSGKSRVFEVLARLVYRPLSSSNLTGPALFRTLHGQGGTLLFDEAERLKQTHNPDVGELVSMLLAGYKRGGQATRLEPVGDSFRPVAFDVFGPKALACIAGLPPALRSRCIPVTMFRAAPGSAKPRRRIDAHPDQWRALRDDLHALALSTGSGWLGLAQREDVCPSMSGRDFELWQPLMALAAWFEDRGASGLLGLVQEHARQTIEAGRDDQTPEADEVLLTIVADAFRAGVELTPKMVLDRARDADPAGFDRWAPRTCTPRLKAYGIPAPVKTTGGARVYRGVTRELLARIQRNYGVDLGLDTAPAAEGTASGGRGESGVSGETLGVGVC